MSVVGTIRRNPKTVSQFEHVSYFQYVDVKGEVTFEEFDAAVMRMYGNSLDAVDLRIMDERCLDLGIEPWQYGVNFHVGPLHGCWTWGKQWR